MFNAHWRLQLPQAMPPEHFNFCRQQLSEFMPGTEINDMLANLASSSPSLLTFYAEELEVEHGDIGMSAVVGNADYKTTREVSRQSIPLPQSSLLTSTDQLLCFLSRAGTAAMHE